MLWKIYFYILIALYVPSYLYNFTIGLNRFWEFIDIFVTAFCFVGLFGFSWKKGIFSQQCWQSLFWGSIGWFIIYHYFIPIPLHITRFDIIAGIVKSICFGILLVTICCYKGMKTKGGAEGVGKATTNSVVISYISILISDFLITLALNALHLKIKYDWHL